MNFDMPYDEVAADAMAGRKVVVFCDTDAQARRCKDRIAAAAHRAGARSVVRPMRDRRVEIDGNVVTLLLVGGYDGRGLAADVVYLSERAKLQHEYAAVTQAQVK